MTDEVVLKKQSAWDSFKHFFKVVFTNQTFLYILKRILTSIISLIIILFIIICLLRAIPEIKLYETGVYNKLHSQAGKLAAENYKNRQLFLFGRRDINGNEINVFQTFGQYLYWIAPIRKQIPVRWDSTYTEVLKYETVGIYFGKSQTYNQNITDILADRMGISFYISMMSLFFSYLISYPLGIAMAKKPGGWVDKLGTIFVVLNYAIPGLVFYMIINKWMGNANGIFGNLFGYVYDENNPMSLFPPIFSLVFLSIPGISIWVRRYMLNEISSDYVKFARSKGLSETRIMYTHVLRNAIVPLVRSIPGAFIGAIVGSYYVETIWTIPGTGRVLTTCLMQKTPDVAVVQGLSLIYAAMSMISFLLGDIVTVFIDPRIKLEK